MKLSRGLLLVPVCALLVIGGCKKKEAQVETSQPNTRTSGTPTLAARPAVPNEAATASSATSTVAAPGLSAETTAKLEGAAWAMKQDEILHDANGQWAASAEASSTFHDAKDQESFSSWQASGAPNVEHESDDPHSWASKTEDGGIEWLDLKYGKPVFATAVRIRESNAPGAIIKVDLYDEAGAAHSIWQGTDPTKGLNYFMLNFPKTSFKVARVRVTLATNIVPGWNEIDAVQLVGTEQ
ncbi:hypothetical protein Acid345_0295 [Candidatus Koribacter versatilis Ellin345]|uniref:Pappalysin-1 SD scarf domain-containing protein n=1 Tax=Koribacter versatilis (strain Ellin345) TaxID=204669 RepID=Q1IV00_KORVE|nr:hypothetical protein [Candidatus Koribacter versatilis]ABF39300.1 hypothetical protein Acid345_0295 [Candidatus Koribacter versatilis Ellin345]